MERTMAHRHQAILVFGGEEVRLPVRDSRDDAFYDVKDFLTQKMRESDQAGTQMPTYDYRYADVFI
jgi:hypothetical protein